MKATLNTWIVTGAMGLFLAAGCAGPGTSPEQKDQLREGVWRATLTTESGSRIPFNFEVKTDSSVRYLEVINGDNRLKVDEITVSGDSVRFLMPFFDSEVIALRQGDSLSGSWVKHLADRDAIMPFQAVRGVAYRFLEYPEPHIANLSGRWATGLVRAGDTRKDKKRV